VSTTTEMTTLKRAHRTTWASGDYTKVADRLVGELGEVAVAHAAPTTGMAVLDVACGAGNATLPAAATGADVVGLDLTPELLDVAYARAAAARLEVEWVEGDAEDLPFADARFDRVLSVVGVQFAPQHERAAAELARVCRPGGRIVLCNWTPQGFIGRLFRTLGAHMPAPPAGVQPPPLWGDEEHVRRLFAGTDVTLGFTRRTVDFRADSAEEFVDFMVGNYGPLVTARARLEPDGRWAAAHADLLELSRTSGTERDGAFLIPSEYLVVTGERSR
jgi:SAM-dependent methyltransferase